jgi:hypothetical protein
MIIVAPSSFIAVMAWSISALSAIPRARNFTPADWVACSVV